MKKEEKKYKHGFTTPNNYFESFEEHLSAKLSSDSLPEKTGFKVPDDYFEQLEESIIQRVEALDEKPKARSLFTARYFTYAASIAASVVLIVSIMNSNSSPVGSIDDIEITSISEYIDDGNIDIDTYDVVALLQEDEIVTMDTENQFFSEESLEEYLLETLDESTLLIE